MVPTAVPGLVIGSSVMAFVGAKGATETTTRTGLSRRLPRPKTGSRRWHDQRISPGRMTWTRFSARTGTLAIAAAQARAAYGIAPPGRMTSSGRHHRPGAKPAHARRTAAVRAAPYRTAVTGGEPRSGREP